MTNLRDLQSQFEAKVDTIKGIANYQFRGLRPEARDEATSNTLALAWKYFLRLAKQGKHDDDAVFNAMVYHATRHTRQGRLPQQRSNSKDVLVYAERGVVGRDGGFDINMFVAEATPVPEAVAYRIDSSAFLATLSEKNRGLALDLASGMTTTEAAKRHGVTPGAISQFRLRFKGWWEKFYAEAA